MRNISHAQQRCLLTIMKILRFCLNSNHICYEEYPSAPSATEEQGIAKRYAQIPCILMHVALFAHVQRNKAGCSIKDSSFSDKGAIDATVSF